MCKKGSSGGGLSDSELPFVNYTDASRFAPAPISFCVTQCEFSFATDLALTCELSRQNQTYPPI